MADQDTPGEAPTRFAANRAGRPEPTRDGNPGDARGRLLRLTVSCPRCGSRPALRITEELARGLGTGPGRTRLGTYQCHRRGCGTIYDLYVTRSLLDEELGGAA